MQSSWYVYEFPPGAPGWDVTSTRD